MSTMNKEGKEPLLYINQPSLESVKGNMQVTYRSSKKKPESRSAPSAPVHETTADMHRPVQEKSEAGQPAPKVQERKTAASSFQRLKPFRDLTIEEKLAYISASISGKVPFPCEFSNGEVTVKGVIVNDEGNDIIIKSFHGEEVPMEKRGIQTIKMIGLQ
ncbi:CotO family spore coat protein [Bacillus sp. KH172YL63]|uniref:CotO family spore coat protein n=1 Tax=Bacillus sp. KH172YL63 TaxID=2709784 RepID=UPI0013E410AC|nr:CotO family spore coat protein [Bacillus sp. KH172YL63]BCB03062.1 hypothetical protein KH172YL63_11950 [Bacillus sp. KH172YL63]